MLFTVFSVFKYYTFVMGKPNIAKMANFLEIDIFVIVACPENSLIDSKVSYFFCTIYYFVQQYNRVSF